MGLTDKDEAHTEEQGQTVLNLGRSAVVEQLYRRDIINTHPAPRTPLGRSWTDLHSLHLGARTLPLSRPHPAGP
jgi:hypothetical protein